MALSILVISTVAVVYILAKITHNVYFHPLSKFPGPKLAAVTHLYEFYYDCVRGGKFIWEIQKMHEKYGKKIEGA